MTEQVHFSASGGCVCQGAWFREGWVEICTPEDWAFIYPRYTCALCGAETTRLEDPLTGDRAYKIGPEGEVVEMEVRA